jgi:hypothetical protein
MQPYHPSAQNPPSSSREGVTFAIFGYPSDLIRQSPKIHSLKRPPG